MGIPGYLLRFFGTVEPYLGSGSYGPQYGPAVSGLPCFAEVGRRLVVTREGRRVGTSATVWFQLGVVCPAESMVTIHRRDGSVMIPRVRVMSADLRDGGGLPVPSHLEISLA